MAHKHKLKFIQRGVEFVGIEGFPYIWTWDFNCRYCPYVLRVDRNGWRNRLVGRKGVPVWLIR